MYQRPHTSSKSPECFQDSQITTTKGLFVCFFALPFPPVGVFVGNDSRQQLIIFGTLLPSLGLLIVRICLPSEKY